MKPQRAPWCKVVELSFVILSIVLNRGLGFSWLAQNLILLFVTHQIAMGLKMTKHQTLS